MSANIKLALANANLTYRDIRDAKVVGGDLVIQTRGVDPKTYKPKELRVAFASSDAAQTASRTLAEEIKGDAGLGKDVAATSQRQGPEISWGNIPLRQPGPGDIFR